MSEKLRAGQSLAIECFWDNTGNVHDFFDKKKKEVLESGFTIDSFNQYESPKDAAKKWDKIMIFARKN